MLFCTVFCCCCCWRLKQIFQFSYLLEKKCEDYYVQQQKFLDNLPERRVADFNHFKQSAKSKKSAAGEQNKNKNKKAAQTLDKNELKKQLKRVLSNSIVSSDDEHDDENNDEDAQSDNANFRLIAEQNDTDTSSKSSPKKKKL